MAIFFRKSVDSLEIKGCSKEEILFRTAFFAYFKTKDLQSVHST